jgi:hypothetical protein
MRVKSRTPKWFRVIRNVGLIITAVGTAIEVCSSKLPTLFTNNSGYLISLGIVIASICQTAKENE